MRVFAILLLAGAVAAEQLVADIPSMMEGIPNHPIHSEVFNARMLNIYGAPPVYRENILVSERAGLKGLLAKPFVAVFKPEGAEELKALFVRNGVSALTSSPDTSFFREFLLSGPEKVGIVLSGAHYLDLPEMSLPIRSLEMPHDFTLNGVFRVIQDTPVYPWVFFTAKDDVRSKLDKIVEFGQYRVQPDSIKIVRDFTPISTRNNGFSDFEDVIVEPSAFPASFPTRHAYLTPYGETVVKRPFYPESFKKSQFVPYYSVPEEYIYYPSEGRTLLNPSAIHPSTLNPASIHPTGLSPAPLKKSFFYYPSESVSSRRTLPLFAN